MTAAALSTPLIWLAVAVGGALGAMVRYAVALLCHARLAVHWPLATLTVNVFGALFLGWLTERLIEAPPEHPWRLILAVGFCGSLTTFSTFALELVFMLRDQQLWKAGAYAAASVLLSLAAVIVGMLIAKQS